MTHVIIKDLSESRTLDIEALRSVRGGHSYYWGKPVDVEEILGEYLDSWPKYPVPDMPFRPVDPRPSQPIPFGPGPADGPL